jgi:hypothetical protein
MGNEGQAVRKLLFGCTGLSLPLLTLQEQDRSSKDGYNERAGQRE